jgi:hypothetical protein
MAAETVPPAGAAAPIPRPRVYWGAYFGASYHLDRIDPAALISSGMLPLDELPGEKVGSCRKSAGGRIKVSRCAGGLVNVSMPAAMALARDFQFVRFRAGLLADNELALVKGEAAELPVKVLSDGDASMTLTFSEGLLTTRYAGPVTASFLAFAQARGEDAPGCGADGVVVDFTDADVKFTGGELDAVMIASNIERAKRPRALVILQKDADMFWAYTFRFALRGVRQCAFHDRGKAEKWARDEVRLGRC